MMDTQARREIAHLLGEITLTVRNFELIEITTECNEPARLVLHRFKTLLMFILTCKDLHISQSFEGSDDTFLTLKNWLSNQPIYNTESALTEIALSSIYTILNRRHWFYWDSKLTSNQYISVYVGLNSDRVSEYDALFPLLMICGAKAPKKEKRVTSHSLLSKQQNIEVRQRMAGVKPHIDFINGTIVKK